MSDTISSPNPYSGLAMNDPSQRAIMAGPDRIILRDARAPLGGGKIINPVAEKHREHHRKGRRMDIIQHARLMFTEHAGMSADQAFDRAIQFKLKEEELFPHDPTLPMGEEG
jgi:hypothetical protein